MNYLNKLINKLKKNSLSLDEFNSILEKSDTIFQSVELEKELLLLNGLPLHFSNDQVSLKTVTTKIKDQTFCIVDIETTAGNARDGQIIEIGAIKYKNNQIIEKYESLINTREIPSKIQELTGITPEMTFDAPSIKTVLEEFKIFLEDDIFVSHPIKFDYKFISDSMKRYDLGGLYNRKLCTINLSEKLIEVERYGLKYLKEYLHIENENHHRAYSDAYCTTMVLKECLALLSNNIQYSEELIDFSNTQ